jgi:hypothetical protein
MPRPGREYWVRLVAELERSGQPHREFASKRGVKVATLQKWLYRFRRERRRNVPLVPVRVVASTAPTARGASERAAGIEVELPSGLRLRFPAGTDGAYIAALVRQLG